MENGTHFCLTNENNVRLDLIIMWTQSIRKAMILTAFPATSQNKRHSPPLISILLYSFIR